MNPRRRGATLIELAVVLVIIAVAASLAVPAFASLRPRPPIAHVRDQMIAALQLARERALALGVPVELTVDPARAVGWLQPRDTTFVIDLPAGCHLEGAPRTTVRFAPDGTASGSTPEIACGGARAALSVDALSGRVDGGAP